MRSPITSPGAAAPVETPAHPTGSSRRARRVAALTAVLLAGATCTGASLPVSHASQVTTVVEDAVMARAVADITAPVARMPWLPDDFAASSGYRPVLADGIPVNPTGECSSPVPLPAEFLRTCRAHDLGYDLLRHAARHGGELGPWARRAIDATFGTRLRQACDARPAGAGRGNCRALAEIAWLAVDLNSRRQGYGTPVTESVAGVAPAGVAAAALPVTVLLLRRRRVPRLTCTDPGGRGPSAATPDPSTSLAATAPDRTR